MANDILLVRKKDGRIVAFEKERIMNSIIKAMVDSDEGTEKDARRLTDEIVRIISNKFKSRTIPAAEEIQDIVENVLSREYPISAKEYIIYRQKRLEPEKTKKILRRREGKINISNNARKILEARYLLRDENGKIKENVTDMFRRVANNVALADKYYKGDVNLTSKRFFDMMMNLEFLPNSPTLMNAGTEIQQLSACFVLPIEDNIESIFSTMSTAALLHKLGGGVGFSFSRLRPRGDIVSKSINAASGPTEILKVYDTAIGTVKQLGKRKGANMAVLRVDHPEIMDFIHLKEYNRAINNFNLSVAVTDKFMKAVKKGKKYELISPRTKKVIARVSARKVFDAIIRAAWKTGDPGLIFIDMINNAHPLKNLGEIEATNPCAEIPLLPYESCNLGSINLDKMLKEDRVDWNKLRETVHNAVHFLDNVIDMNNYPVNEIDKKTKMTRKIGLGIMGFADMLYQMKIAYNSETAFKTAEEIVRFISQEAIKKSIDLARERGVFPGWYGSEYEKKKIKLRNGTLLAIAPTGTIAMIAETSNGIEPNFSISFTKKVLQGDVLKYMNKHFEKEARERNILNDKLVKEIDNRETIKDINEIPADMKRVYVTAHDISPEGHIKMQSIFQKYVDNAISKTINMPEDSKVKDVEKAYIMAYDCGCKGITIYRDRSMENQVVKIKLGEY